MKRNSFIDYGNFLFLIIAFLEGASNPFFSSILWYQELVQIAASAVFLNFLLLWFIVIMPRDGFVIYPTEELPKLIFITLLNSCLWGFILKNTEQEVVIVLIGLIALIFFWGYTLMYSFQRIESSGLDQLLD